jgi:hypothetical protein
METRGNDKAARKLGLGKLGKHAMSIRKNAASMLKDAEAAFDYVFDGDDEKHPVDDADSDDDPWDELEMDAHCPDAMRVYVHVFGAKGVMQHGKVSELQV